MTKEPDHLPVPNPTIKIQPDERPPSWDRRALFLSNVRSIFYDNVDDTRQLMDEITGSHSYGGRVMSILDLLFHERPNLMLLEVPPEPSLVKYLLSEIGLSMPQYDTIDLSGYERLASATDLKTAATTPLLPKLGENRCEWVDGFVTGSTWVKIAERV